MVSVRAISQTKYANTDDLSGLQSLSNNATTHKYVVCKWGHIPIAEVIIRLMEGQWR